MNSSLGGRRTGIVLALFGATCLLLVSQIPASAQTSAIGGEDGPRFERAMIHDASQNEESDRLAAKSPTSEETSALLSREILHRGLDSDDGAPADRIDDTHRPRFVGHFMGWDDPSERVPLLYASPKAFEWPFERELDDIRSAEALVRNWTRYRDDDVVVEMDPLSTSVRIVLPLNRALKTTDR